MELLRMRWRGAGDSWSMWHSDAVLRPSPAHACTCRSSGMSNNVGSRPLRCSNRVLHQQVLQMHCRPATPAHESCCICGWIHCSTIMGYCICFARPWTLGVSFGARVPPAHVYRWSRCIADPQIRGVAIKQALQQHQAPLSALPRQCDYRPPSTGRCTAPHSC